MEGRIRGRICEGDWRGKQEEELGDGDAEEGGEELAEERVARLGEGGFDGVELEDYCCALCVC